MKLLNRCATPLIILSLSSSLLCAETKSTPSEKEEAAEKEALTPELRPALAIQSGKVDFHAKIPRTGTPFPRFSWLIAPQDRYQLQSAYQIIVAESEEECKAGGKLAWDSGRVESNSSSLVEAPEATLSPSKTYFWRARLWNNTKVEGKWSRVFTTISTEKTVKENLSLGTFECSDEKLNAIIENCEKNCETAFQWPAQFPPGDQPWGAPLQASLRGYSFTNDITPFLRKYLKAANEAIAKAPTFPALIPAPKTQKEPSPGYSEAPIIGAFVISQLTGDKTFVKPYLTGYAKHLDSVFDNDPKFEGKPLGKALEDYGHLDDPTSAEFLTLAYFALGCRITGELATGDGHLPYIMQHKERFSRAHKGFAANFIDEKGNLTETSQTARILAIRFGILPPESKEKELKALLADLKERGLRCGILGQTALLPVLTWTGNTDQALTYARNFSQKDQEPSIVANAVVQEWLFSFLAGFIHEGLGFKVGRISPFIPEDKSLTSLSASHLTPYGKISVTWEKKKDHLSVKVTIPPNTTGIIALPASPEAEIMEGGLSLEEAPFCQLIGDKKGRKEIIAQSGNYHFTVKSREDAQSNK